MNLTLPLIDQSLILACFDKNRNSQKKLYSMLSPGIFAALMHSGFSQKEAEEILQRVFIAMFTSIENYNSNCSFEAWCLNVYKTTVRQYSDEVVYKINM